MNNTNSFKTHRLVESALMISLSAILSFLIIFRLPFGGTITLCSMLPLVFISFRYGAKWGLATCFAYGLIQTVQGVAEGTFTAAAMGVENGVYTGGFFTGSPLLATFFIVFLDYILAFTVIGFAGIFVNSQKLGKRFQDKPVAAVITGTVFAGFLRYASHVVSGAIFFGVWGEWFFTQEGFYSWGQTLVDTFPSGSLYWIYSFIYNATFIIPEIIITCAAGAVIVKTVPKLVSKKVSAA